MLIIRSKVLLRNGCIMIPNVLYLKARLLREFHGTTMGGHARVLFLLGEK